MSTATLEREQAIGTLFNLEHNLTEYNQLVGHKYSHTMTELEGYAKPSEKYNTSFEEKPTRFSRDMLQEYARPTKPNIVQTQPQTFRPKIVAPEIEVELKNSLILEEPVAETIPFSVHAFEEETVKATDVAPAQKYITSIKLNPAGMVAVVSFIAVTVMILAFIIANGIKIGANSANISAIESENAILATQVSAQAAENAEFVANYEAWFLQENGMTLEQYMDIAGFVPVATAPAPEVAAWTPIGNLDESTNLFDILSKFFSNWF